MTVICDWLDVTYSPDSHPRQELRLFLGALGYTCSDYSTSREVWTHVDVSHGTLISQEKDGSFCRISASGGILHHLRSTGYLTDYLAMLHERPHRVTRLDAAHDVSRDASAVLSELKARYPREVSLNRQRPIRCHFLMSARLDGLQSGTMYAGHRSKARVTGRVYDKALEAYEKRQEVLPPTTRYELTFKDGIASLWDALRPSSIFWAHAGNLIDLPDDAPAWEPSHDPGWTYKRPEQLPAVRLARAVSDSSDLTMMLELADSLGVHGRNTLMHALAKRVGVEHSGLYFKTG
jgi:hypothetical protein